MAKKTLQQRGKHAREFAWSIIIGSGLAGTLILGGLARKVLPRS